MQSELVHKGMSNKGNIKAWSWVSNWEPRCKIIVCFSISFLIIALDNPLYLLTSFIILLTIAISAGFSFGYIWRKLTHLLPFLGLMSFPLIFSEGFPITYNRLTLPFLLVFKALSVSVLMIIMILTQPQQKLLNALSHLRIPTFLITILLLSWRYTFVMLETLKTVQRALISRLFNNSLNKRTFLTYGSIFGGTLIKALDKSERVHNAMISRGFNGHMTNSHPQPISKIDLLKSTLLLGFFITILLFEKGWLKFSL